MDVRAPGRGESSAGGRLRRAPRRVGQAIEGDGLENVVERVELEGADRVPASPTKGRNAGWRHIRVAEASREERSAAGSA